MAEKSRLDALYADKAKADFISSVSFLYVITNFSRIAVAVILMGKTQRKLSSLQHHK